MSEKQIKRYVEHITGNKEACQDEMTWLIQMTLNKESSAHMYLTQTIKQTLNDIDYES